MTDAFTTLGLSRDADERAIKRAYAALLRVHRPDDDPAGFQRINEAYQDALRWRQWRDSMPPDLDDDADEEVYDETFDDDGDDTASDSERPVRARVPVHAPPARDDDEIRIRVTDAEVDPEREGDGDDTPEVPAADAAELGPVPPPLPPADATAPRDAGASPIAAALAIAGRGDTAALLAWLRAEPTFWSLQDKAWWGEQLLYALQASPVAMPGECFDGLMGFFGLDDVHASRHRAHLGWLRDRCVQWWVLQPRRPAKGLSRVQLAAQASERDNVARLQGPFRWPRVLWHALRPGVPEGMAAFVNALGHWDADDLPPNVDARTLAFWRDARAEVPAMTFARFAVFAARTSVAGIVFALLVMLGGLQDTSADAWAVVVATVSAYFSIAALAGTWLAVTTYIRWEPVRWPLEWPGWVVPLLAAACLLVLYAAGDRIAAGWWAGLTLFLQGWRELYRWLLHRPGTLNATVWLAFLVWFVAVTLMSQGVVPEVVLAIALIRWGKMTWAIRKRFRAA